MSQKSSATTKKSSKSPSVKTTRPPSSSNPFEELSVDVSSEDSSRDIASGSSSSRSSEDIFETSQKSNKSSKKRPERKEEKKKVTKKVVVVVPESEDEAIEDMSVSEEKEEKSLKKSEKPSVISKAIEKGKRRLSIKDKKKKKERDESVEEEEEEESKTKKSKKSFTDDSVPKKGKVTKDDEPRKRAKAPRSAEEKTNRGAAKGSKANPRLYTAAEWAALPERSQAVNKPCPFCAEEGGDPVYVSINQINAHCLAVHEKPYPSKKPYVPKTERVAKKQERESEKKKSSKTVRKEKGSSSRSNKRTRSSSSSDEVSDSSVQESVRPQKRSKNAAGDVSTSKTTAPRPVQSVGKKTDRPSRPSTPTVGKTTTMSAPLDVSEGVAYFLSFLDFSEKVMVEKLPSNIVGLLLPLIDDAKTKGVMHSDECDRIRTEMAQITNLFLASKKGETQEEVAKRHPERFAWLKVEAINHAKRICPKLGAKMFLMEWETRMDKAFATHYATPDMIRLVAVAANASAESSDEEGEEEKKESSRSSGKDSSRSSVRHEDMEIVLPGDAAFEKRTPPIHPPPPSPLRMTSSPSHQQLTPSRKTVPVSSTPKKKKKDEDMDFERKSSKKDEDARELTRVKESLMLEIPPPILVEEEEEKSIEKRQQRAVSKEKTNDDTDRSSDLFFGDVGGSVVLEMLEEDVSSKKVPERSVQKETQTQTQPSQVLNNNTITSPMPQSILVTDKSLPRSFTGGKAPRPSSVSFASPENKHAKDVLSSSSDSSENSSSSDSDSDSGSDLETNFMPNTQLEDFGRSMEETILVEKLAIYNNQSCRSCRKPVLPGKMVSKKNLSGNNELAEVIKNSSYCTDEQCGCVYCPSCTKALVEKRQGRCIVGTEFYITGMWKNASNKK